MFFERSGYPLFTIAGIEVSVSLWYVILMAMIVFLGSNLAYGLIFALAVTFSLLIHEFGHAVVCKYYELRPSILLHGFGGLCFHEEARTDARDAFIVVAGPLVEIVFGVAAFALLYLAPGLVSAVNGIPQFLQYFAWVSIVWGVGNLLLPLWPLDGGKLFHLLLRRFTNERNAQEWTLKTSIASGALVVLAGIYFKFFFLLFLAAFLIMDNLNTLRGGGGRLVGRSSGRVEANDFLQELMNDAESALTDEDWREAARLCHQARASTSQIPQKMLQRIWEILTIGTAYQGKCEEAMGYAKRAPDTEDVRKAVAFCESELAEEDSDEEPEPAAKSDPNA